MNHANPSQGTNDARRLPRALCGALILAFLAAGLGLAAGPAGAQAPTDPWLEDPENDQRVTTQHEVGGQRLGDNGGASVISASYPVDLRAVRIGAETATMFSVFVDVKTLQPQAPKTRQLLQIRACFKVLETGFTLPAQLTLYPDHVEPSNSLSLRLGEACSVGAFPTGSSAGNAGTVRARVDQAANRIEFEISKAPLADKLPGKMLPKGSELKDFRILSWVEESLRISYYDQAPDEGPFGTPYEFEIPAMHPDVRILVANARYGNRFSCLGRDGPVVSVEAGAYEGIPLSIESRLPRLATFNVSATALEAGWEVRVRPEVSIPPPAVNWSQIPATLVIKVPELQGKACGLVRLSARDMDDPDAFTETTLEVMASPGISTQRSTLYFHRPNGGTQGTDYAFTLNTLEEDPTADPAYRYPFVQGRNPVTALMSVLPNEFRAKTDTPFPYNIVIPSDGSVEAVLRLSSGTIDSNARIIGSLYSGATDVIARGMVEVTGISNQVKDVALNMPIQPLPWHPPNRTLTANVPIYFHFRYEPLSPVPGGLVPPGTVQGQIWFTPSGSHIKLPIEATVRANSFGIGKAGGLVSLSLADSTPERMVSPGRSVDFNFTVSHETGDVDDYRVTWNLASDPKGDWKAVVLEGASRRLGAGENGKTAIRVQAPLDAPDGATAGIFVKVKGARDEAESTAYVVTRVAKDQPRGDANAPLVAHDERTSAGTPGPAAAWLLVVLFLAAIASRRPPRER